MTQSKLSPERERKLRQVAEMMNTRHRFPFPIAQPLLDCFDVALADEELEFVIKVGTEPATPEEIVTRCGLPKDLAEPIFMGLIKKGLFWPQEKPGGGELFQLAGIMLGWFEVYLSDGAETPKQKEFAQAVDRLFHSFGKLNVFPLRTLLNNRLKDAQPAQSIVGSQKAEALTRTTIPVDRAIDAAPMKIYPARTVRQLIEKHGDSNSIAVVHCFCRQYHKLIDEHCRFEHPAESCIAIGPLSHYAVKYGGARYTSKAEAIALIEALEKKGSVHQVFHQGEDVDRPEIAICNCCWDCCGVFGSYNRGYMPLRLKSYFIAQAADTDNCSGCEACVDHCPVCAISMHEGKARLDDAKCIGCGQCELQCPEGAFNLMAKERNVFLPLIKRSDARMPS